LKNRNFALLSLLLALVANPAGAQAGAKTGNGAICDHNTALTLIGIDTRTGSMLFAVPPLASGGSGWIVELDAAGKQARAWPDPPKGLFSGSVGPGPVLAAIPCGENCVQPMQWNSGSWTPLGEPMRTPTASNLAPSYDDSGTPWLMLQGAGGPDGATPAWGFRFTGREWESRGAIKVTAVGQPQALPAPQRRDGILVGTGLFSASGRPEAWIASLPNLPPARQGQIVALTGTSAAYLSADGVVYLSDDAGKKWRRDTWTPWGGKTSEVVGSWRQGSDYWVDISFGNQEGGLRLVWYDRRTPAAGERILLTRLTPGGGWSILAEAPSEIRTNSGDMLPIAQVLTPKGSTWILLSSCANTPQGSGLVLRVYDGGKLSDPRFLPFTRP
jgi:hypothetical protein